MDRLKNKVALITGGNSGIGLATAKEFIHEGAKVVISGRSEDTLHAAVHELGGHDKAHGVKAEVSNLNEIDRLLKETERTFGKIDILVANAGIFKGAPIADFTEELYDELVDINLKGAFFTVQKALPYLNDGASVIFTTSTVNEMGMPTASIYAATKAALRSLARSLSADLLSRRIRVNAVAPGPIATPIVGRLGMPKEIEQGLVDGLISGTALKRMGTAEEVAKAILFLASDESTFILGEEIVVDGGMNTL